MSPFLLLYDFTLALHFCFTTCRPRKVQSGFSAVQNWVSRPCKTSWESHLSTFFPLPLLDRTVWDLRHKIIGERELGDDQKMTLSQNRTRAPGVAVITLAVWVKAQATFLHLTWAVDLLMDRRPPAKPRWLRARQCSKMMTIFFFSDYSILIFFSPRSLRGYWLESTNISNTVHALLA